jgi:hypothetical protein
MVASRRKIFTTEEVAALIGLSPEDTWRVTKFIKSREYGIKPAITMGSGHGSRRLYDIENVCEIGLALRLLEAGLRPQVIGHVLKEVGQYSNVSPKLKIGADAAKILYLAILLSPRTGKPLDVSRIQYVDFVEGFSEVEHIIEQIAQGLKSRGLPNVDVLVHYDVLLVGVGLMFRGINERLAMMKEESSEAER